MGNMTHETSLRKSGSIDPEGSTELDQFSRLISVLIKLHFREIEKLWINGDYGWGDDLGDRSVGQLRRGFLEEIEIQI